MTAAICSVDGCNRKREKRSWCNRHYLRWRTYGDPVGSACRPSVSERFWAKVEKTESCWNWTAGVTVSGGYGVFHPGGGTSVRAHRFCYEQAIGAIPAGMHLDHTCHNPRCVRPDHLRVVTNKQNCEHQSGASSRSKSGVLGVHWHSGASKWTAQVMHNRKSHYVGLFNSISEAERAVVAKRNELFTHNDVDRQ